MSPICSPVLLRVLCFVCVCVFVCVCECLCVFVCLSFVFCLLSFVFCLYLVNEELTIGVCVHARLHLRRV